jgi:Prokaryotic N-terminal methylation motif
MIQRHCLHAAPVWKTSVTLSPSNLLLLSNRTPRSPRARRRGLTLVELLIGLAITAITCAIMALLINATAVGTNTQNDGRRSLVRLQMVKAALEDELSNCRSILTSGSNYLVYWIGDQPGAVTLPNNAVNLSELRLLEIDSSGNLNLWYCKFPAGTTNAAILAYDQTCAATTDFYALAVSLKGTTNWTSTTLATGATSMTTSLDSASPTSAHYVHVIINLNDGLVSKSIVLGVNVANPGAPW